MLYLAIDLHSKQWTVNLRHESGDVLLKRQVSTQPEKVRSFLADLQRQAEPQGGYVAILEICGFADWLLKLLPEYGCRQLVVVQPERQDKHKTDRRDADRLGELLWSNRHRLAAGQRLQNVRHLVLPSPAEAEDRQLTALRRRLGQQRTRTLNRIQHLLLKHNLKHSAPTKGLQTKAMRRWLAAVPLPELDRLEMNLLLEQWQVHESHLEQVNRRIEQRQAASPTAAILASVPGGGGYSSLALASRIGRIERFATPGSLANYFGLTPGSRNSGEARQRLGSITKRGSAIARFLLGQTITHVLRKDARMRQWYKGVRRRRGSKIARVAAMRKLVTIFWHMLQRQQPYRVVTSTPRTEEPGTA